MAELTQTPAKKTTAQKVEAALKDNKNKGIAQDIVSGAKFGEAVVGPGGLGRLADQRGMEQAMSGLEAQAQGFSGAEATARRERAVEQMGASQQAQQRALQARLAAAGVKGGAAGAQIRDLVGQQAGARAGMERDLFLAGEEARRAGTQQLYQAASGLGQFDLGQAAKEKNIALQAGLGFAQLGSAERAAIYSSNAAKAAAAAQAQGLGSGGGILSKGKKLFGKYNMMGIASKPIKRIFCHEENTLVKMQDGTVKPIKELVLGDELHLGGKVTMKADMANEYPVYEFMGEFVTGTHLIINPVTEKWCKVEDLDGATRREDMDNIVICPIETEYGIYVTEAGYISGDLSSEYEALVEASNENKEMGNVRLLSSL